jgi:hypothetical protein
LKKLAFFKKRNSNYLELDVDGMDLAESCEFAKHFHQVCKNPCPVVFPNLSSTSQFLCLAPAFDSNFSRALKHLRPTKSVRDDDVPGFVIKGSSDIFMVYLFLNTLLI